MATPIRDQYHGDPTLTVLIAAFEDRPQALEAIKTASFDPAAIERLPPGAFAWEDARRFPLHTREDTIASIAYRSKYAGAVPAEVDERLQDAVEAYGIDSSMFASTKTAGELPKHVIDAVLGFDKPNYAVPSQERLPLGNAEQIKVAEEVLVRDGHVLPLDERVEAFARLEKAARAHDVKLAAEADTYAGLLSCNTQMLRDRIGMRAATTKVAECAAAYDALDIALQKVAPVVTDRPTLLKLASRLQELDEQAGLVPLYGKRIFDPMKTVFNGQQKLAMGPGGATCDLAGTPVPVEQLMQLPPDIWHQVDVPELAEVQDPGEFKTIFDTLPLDIKMVLAKQLGH